MPLRDRLPDERRAVDPIEQDDLRQRIQQALATLSDGHRDVFVLAHNQGLKYHEIGDILDIPEGTVKSRMFAAMRKLRVELADLAEPTASNSSSSAPKSSAAKRSS